jgi:MFS family permease
LRDKAPMERGAPGYRQLLQIADVRLLLSSACLSRLAGRMLMLAIVLYVLERFHSPELAGWSTFATIAPGLIVSPLAGAWLDRIGPARGIVVDMAVSALLILALATAGLTDALGVPLLLIIVTLFSLTTPLSSAGIRALLPRLVPGDSLDRANALDTTSYALIDIGGPAIAGLLFGMAGPNASMFTIATLYALAGLCLVPLAVRPSPHAPRARGSRPPGARQVLHEAVAGVGYVLRNLSLRGLALSYALYQLCLGILFVAVPTIVVQQLGAEGYVVGGLWALTGLAGAVGALSVGHMRTTGRERTLICAGLLATSVATFPIAALFGLPGLVIGLALVGFFSGPVDVGVLSLRQRRTEPGWLGRVLAVSMSLNMSGLPVGAALGGIVVSLSVSATFAVAGAAAMLAAFAAWVLIPRR